MSYHHLGQLNLAPAPTLPASIGAKPPPPAPAKAAGGNTWSWIGGQLSRFFDAGGSAAPSPGYATPPAEPSFFERNKTLILLGGAGLAAALIISRRRK